MGNGPSKQTDRKSETGGRENNNETVRINAKFLLKENFTL